MLWYIIFHLTTELSASEVKNRRNSGLEPPSLAKACKQLKNKQIKISLVRNIFILIYIDLTKNIYFAT